MSTVGSELGLRNGDLPLECGLAGPLHRRLVVRGLAAAAARQAVVEGPFPEAEAILLALDEAPEDGDLHVQGDLDVLEVLVLLHLVGQLVQEPLDFVVLGVDLGAVAALHVLHVLTHVGNLLVEVEVGRLKILDLAGQEFDPMPGLLHLLESGGVAATLVAKGSLKILDLNIRVMV